MPLHLLTVTLTLRGGGRALYQCGENPSISVVQGVPQTGRHLSRSCRRLHAGQILLDRIDFGRQTLLDGNVLTDEQMFPQRRRTRPVGTLGLFSFRWKLPIAGPNLLSCRRLFDIFYQIPV